MTCILLNYLQQQKRQSDIRGERVNSARLAVDIQSHLDRCVVCAGVSEDHLVENFFAGLDVKVLKEHGAKSHG